MTIRDRIRNHLAPAAANTGIVDLRIGLGYTAVRLETGAVGLAGTPIRDAVHGCTVFDGGCPRAGSPATVCLDLITSDYPIEAAVGLATANALANVPSPGLDAGDVLAFIRPEPDDHIGMIGHFAPMVGGIRKSGARLTIFERIDHPAGGFLPPEAIPEMLPDCTIALITATAIINGTFDEIIAFAAGCRAVVVLGASTPLLPPVFSGTPVTCLSGVIVTRPDDILRIVSCGGGMRRFKQAIRKVNLAIGTGFPPLAFPSNKR